MLHGTCCGACCTCTRCFVVAATSSRAAGCRAGLGAVGRFEKLTKRLGGLHCTCVTDVVSLKIHACGSWGAVLRGGLGCCNSLGTRGAHVPGGMWASWYSVLSKQWRLAHDLLLHVP